MTPRAAYRLRALEGLTKRDHGRTKPAVRYEPPAPSKGDPLHCCIDAHGNFAECEEHQRQHERDEGDASYEREHAWGSR